MCSVMELLLFQFHFTIKRYLFLLIDLKLYNQAMKDHKENPQGASQGQHFTRPAF